MIAPRIVTETKHTLDGRQQRFSCLGLLITPSLAVIRFDHASARQAGGFDMPAGSHTLGYFWRARGYNCYRIADVSGAVIAYRFDVVERVRIGATTVSYLDLLLDFWLSPRGAFTVEDEDEVAEGIARGWLSPSQAERIDRVRRTIERRHERIRAEVDAIATELRNVRRG